MEKVPSKVAVRPGLQIDVSGELRAFREQDLTFTSDIAGLRARVSALEGWKRTVDSHRTAVMVAVATAVVTAFGAVIVLLFSHHA